MKKMLLTLASALLLSNAVMAADIAPVASVVDMEGSAVISRGDASIALKKGMVLLEGDKVVVLEKSGLQMAYADCTINHQQNTIVAVSANAQCAAGQQFGIGAPSAAAGAGSASGTGAAASATAAGTAGAGTAAVGGGLAAGGVVAGGVTAGMIAAGVAAAIAVGVAVDSANSDDAPASS